MSPETLTGLVEGLIPTDFSWNEQPSELAPIYRRLPAEPTAKQLSKIKIVDEGLRDGIHGSPEYPDVKKMLKYIGYARELGIDTMTVGIYHGEGNKIDLMTKDVLREMHDQYPDITPIVLSLATRSSLKWASDCKELNPKLQTIVFMGSAPTRMLVQDWKPDTVLSKMAWATREATQTYNLDVIGATEHTTQTPPDFLKKIITAQVENGAKVFCIADTIGDARPIGTYRIVRFVRSVLDELGAKDVIIDWHGHRDKGNDLSNAMMAISAGANRVHTVPYGIGERAGNTQLETVLINATDIIAEANAQRHHKIPTPWNLKALSRVLSYYAEIVGVPEPSHGPMGKNAFETAIGLHTDAMLKAVEFVEAAKNNGHSTLATELDQMSRTIYTSIDPESVGRQHVIYVGPSSGRSTVRYACRQLSGEDCTFLTDEDVDTILMFAKFQQRRLHPLELKRFIENKTGFPRRIKGVAQTNSLTS